MFSDLLNIEFESFDKFNINIQYANNFTRICYSIIKEIIINYKEQILIIDIKKNKYCNICRVSLKKRKDSTRYWEYCISKYTQVKLIK